MRARVVLIATVGLCLAACGAFRAPAAGNSNVIPWIDATPTPLVPTPRPVPVIPAGTPACTTGDLHVAYVGGQGLGGGQLTATISFVNVARFACFLEGTPGFALLDAHGNLIKTTPSGFRITDRTDPVLLVQEGSQPQAYLPFVWPAIDQASGGSACPSASTASAIRLELPQGGGVVTVSAISPTARPGAIAPCHGLIAVGAFQAAERPVEPTPSPHPFAYHVVLPASVRAGENLRFTVTFTNITAAPVSFSDPCPAYREELYPVVPMKAAPLGKHFYLLNCRPVGSIVQQSSVTFAMVLDVPVTAAPGRYTLLWDLDEGVDLQDIQRLPITIVG